MEPSTDVFSLVARRRGLVVERLSDSTRTPFKDRYSRPGGQKLQDVLEERLRDNTLPPVPEQVAFRRDWPTFLATLPERDKWLADFLAAGHSGQGAAACFGVTPARVTQLRKRWRRRWLRLQRAEPSSSISH